MAISDICTSMKICFMLLMPAEYTALMQMEQLSGKIQIWAYCEFNIISNQLIYECNSALNFTDNFLVRDQYSDKTVFKKIK